jgi:hypothetical protein
MPNGCPNNEDRQLSFHWPTFEHRKALLEHQPVHIAYEAQAEPTFWGRELISNEAAPFEWEGLIF